ncbi:unnamed protein product, partial [Mesorhabditis belari]|uniref:G-protein coupled receptors family 1 profile domain-containing protein n=1 Tax=Mesorhabditis belari TaxID=2138241 RepID=A0AAF3EVP9_9BILA
MTSVHSPGPSMQVYSTEVTSFSLPYAFLFIFGTAGNVAVLTYVFFVTRSLRSSVTALGNTFVYMVVLSGVDLLVTMSIPFHLSEKKPKAETITYPIVKQMCVDGLSITMKFWFLCAMVVVAFLLPCTLLTYFYVRIILRLRRQIRTMLQSRIPIKRITIYTLVVTLFYLACQIPYWLPQIYLIFAKIFRLSLSRDFIKITYVAHMLPFLAAAFNWIFYAQLNSQFKKGLILVTERMHRKMTRTGTKRVADTMDELCIEMMSRSEEAPNCVCPNCEHPLSIKVQKISTSVNGNNASHV